MNVLAQVDDLRVISRTSAFAFKGKDVDIPTIAAQLNVTHVLEGSVRKAGNNVRITAQLIEVETDSHLWSDAYNRKLENIFDIQEEISMAIAGELQVTLGTGGNTGNPTENMEAWQLFLRGRHLYQNRGEAQVARSVELLKQAVELDPNFADAWANLAAANMVYGYNQDEGFENLQLHTDKIRRLDPDFSLSTLVTSKLALGNPDTAGEQSAQRPRIERVRPVSVQQWPCRQGTGVVGSRSLKELSQPEPVYSPDRCSV